MGDIKSRPKTPAADVVYVPQYVYTSPTAGTSGAGATDAGQTPSTGTTETTPEQQREKSLLSRSRSLAGTILTGYRGILAPSEQQGQRKILLGE